MSQILTPENLRELTGKVQPAAQIRALTRMRIRHKVRPDGKPIVVWSALDTEEKQQVEPDFDSIRRGG